MPLLRPTGVCYGIVRLVNHHLNSSEQLGTVCDVRNCCFNKILSRKGKPAKSLRSPQLFGLFSFHGGLWFPLYQLKSTPNGQLSPSLKSRTLLQTSKVPTTAFGCKYTRCASLVCWLVPARLCWAMLMVLCSQSKLTTRAQLRYLVLQVSVLVVSNDTSISICSKKW